MLDPHSLYELVDDQENSLPSGLTEADRPVLVHALTGFVDAGAASRLARNHLDSGGGVTLARFDLDQIMDYRTRRPMMVFHQGVWEHYEKPRLALSALRDQDGRSFLLLSGPEPDLQWERFVAATVALIERFQVRLTIGLTAIPMAVPHTRPTGLTASGTRPALTAEHEVVSRRIQVPGSLGSLLEYRLGQAGHDAMGFAVHVPHYLAQTEYPAAAERLLQAVEATAGLRLSLEELHAVAQMVKTEVDRQITQAEEASALVSALEQQYDAQIRQRASAEGTPASTGPLPTADELAAELERFLADQ